MDVVLEKDASCTHKSLIRQALPGEHCHIFSCTPEELGKATTVITVGSAKFLTALNIDIMPIDKII